MLQIHDNITDSYKGRKITLHKEPMYQEIDGHTSKFVEAGDSPVKQGNAVSSDTAEDLDGSLITRLMEYRDAKLRDFFVLQEECIHEVSNIITEVATYDYNLLLPEDFNDAQLKSLAMLMHKYIVWGTLFDWYTQLGLMNEAAAYGRQLEQVEEDIRSMINTAGYEKIPLQPFGPAYKI